MSSSERESRKLLRCKEGSYWAHLGPSRMSASYHKQLGVRRQQWAQILDFQPRKDKARLSPFPSADRRRASFGLASSRCRRLLRSCCCDRRAGFHRRCPSYRRERNGESDLSGADDAPSSGAGAGRAGHAELASHIALGGITSTRISRARCGRPSIPGSQPGCCLSCPTPRGRCRPARPRMPCCPRPHSRRWPKFARS
jgi:hypothetical protein